MPIAVLYEHAEWFLPLFEALDRRGLAYVRLDAARLAWNPEEPPSFSLLVNRMSPSAFLRGHGQAIHATTAFLAYVERYGVPVVNGSETYRLETSKSSQIDLFQRLGIRHPRTRIVNHASQAPGAARGLAFPVLVKPNVGGSGGGIQAFPDAETLEAASGSNAIDLGLDSTALVQEQLPARGGSITRVEMLAGEVLYAIRITPPQGFGFNLCPADICREENRREVDLGVCPTKPAMQIEAAEIPVEARRTVTAIARAGRFDLCGIEYLIDDRDGLAYYYDINALSNFVTDAVAIVGFDPFERVVDLLERRQAERPPVPVLGVSEAQYAPELTRWLW